ncbi:MAG: undecaprenyldiphospho-muramoylpentapeptide beta-N-acetylglucosaminyltransferase [Nitrospirae bacterium]|nr:undecaprenyldiphospho-muramoylpentapeptide beta-N-acetylglucosaminyltransferase [Nitrospirota bacterium]
MRIIIAGGGTGGHLFPGIALAREFKKVHASTEIMFVGTAEGIEATVVPKEGFDVRFIRSEGLVRVGAVRTLRSLAKLPLSMKDSYTLLRTFNPDLVFGFGGYSSGPVVLTAFLMGIPTMIHEQNSIPGVTNKLLGKFVRAVAVTYQDSIEFFPKYKTHLTGNPVRKEILRGNRERGHKIFGLDKERFTIFVFGGSSGAHRINRAVTEGLSYLEDLKDKIQFLHQTGEKDFSATRESYRSMGFHGTVIPFIYEMADAYAASDLVISRAGASTIAELTACGKASILIPYPFAAGNHQELNARKLWDLGAAHMILDRDLKGKTLVDSIRYIYEDPDAIGTMEKISRSLGKPDAAQKIVEIAMGLLKLRTKN